MWTPGSAGWAEFRLGYCGLAGQSSGLATSDWLGSVWAEFGRELNIDYLRVGWLTVS
jgi:hypothetical protein